MIVFTPKAGRQVRALRQHYEKRGRPEASRALVAALEEAWRTIFAHPAAGLPAPRPYPGLAHEGRAWVKAGRYWIAYSPSPLVTVGVFYEAADIPGDFDRSRVGLTSLQEAIP